MWSRLILSLATALILIFFIDYGTAIKCWSCRSDNDPQCVDPFDNRTVPLTDCDGDNKNLKHIWWQRAAETMCRKIRQKVNGEWRFIRSCAYLGEPGIDGDERYCLLRSGTWDIHIEYCTCKAKDGCNSSSSVSASVFGVLVTTGMAIARLRGFL